MWSTLLPYLGSIGLILDVIGASILFFVVITISDQIGRGDDIAAELLRKKTVKRKAIALKTGYFLIVVGFALQFFASLPKH